MPTFCPLSPLAWSQPVPAASLSLQPSPTHVAGGGVGHKPGTCFVAHLFPELLPAHDSISRGHCALQSSAGMRWGTKRESSGEPGCPLSFLQLATVGTAARPQAFCGCPSPPHPKQHSCLPRPTAPRRDSSGATSRQVRSQGCRHTGGIGRWVRVSASGHHWGWAGSVSLPAWGK